MKNISAIVFLLAFLFPLTDSSAADRDPLTGPLGFGNSEYTGLMQTDRARYTAGTEVIETGHYQIEGGYSFAYQSIRSADIRTHSLPEVNFRTGIAPTLEASLSWQGIVDSRREIPSRTGAVTSSRSGVTNFIAGFKKKSGSFNGLDITTMFRVSLPIFDSDFASDRAEPEVRLLWSQPPGKGKNIFAGSFTLASPHDAADVRFVKFGASAMGTYCLNEKLDSFYELYTGGN